MDSAISAIGSLRADLGALQNRFQSTIRNLSNISENVSAARSKIKDKDFEKEKDKLKSKKIIKKASNNVLYKDNKRPQAALQLLG